MQLQSRTFRYHGYGDVRDYYADMSAAGRGDAVGLAKLAGVGVPLLAVRAHASRARSLDGPPVARGRRLPSGGVVRPPTPARRPGNVTTYMKMYDIYIYI